MKLSSLVAGFLTIITFSKCGIGNETVNGNGQLKTENRNSTQTDKIRLIGDMDVFIVSGAPGVRVEADENLMQYIETNMEKGWLEIKTKEHFNINSDHPVKVYITTETLSDLSIGGSGNITCSSEFTSDTKTSFEVAGSGNMLVKINAPSVKAEVAGSGNLEITGETKDVDVEVSGSGNFKGQELKAENAQVEIAGSGRAYVFADDNLKADISGSGTVKYSGKANVKSDISGSGSVSKIE